MSAVVMFLVHDNMSVLERNFAIVDEQVERWASAHRGTGDAPPERLGGLKPTAPPVYCIYENDSTDGSAEWLRELAARRADVHVLSEWGYRTARAHGRDALWRYARMAACRNRCLDLARQHAPDVDYAVVLDIDFAGFEQVDIAAAIEEIDGLHPEWQALCGSGLSQRDLGVYGPSMHVVRTRGSLPVRLYDIAAMETDPRQERLAYAAMARPADHPPLRVRSAFGGIAVYKREPLYSLHYEGSDCEHVCLHRGMQEVFMSYKLCPLMVAL